MVADREKRITIRVDAALYAEVKQILRELGKDTSSTVREFFGAIKRERGISFLPMRLERKSRDGHLPQD